MKKFTKLIKNEDGQSLVIFALLLVILIGFVALVVDVGSLYIKKIELQTAADAAALAGAQYLPNASTAVGIANSLAESYEVPASGIKHSTPYSGDTNMIEIVCTETVSLTFARVLGLESSTVSARAVAKKDYKWDGEALPLVNTGSVFPSETNKIVLRTNKSPGDKSQIFDFYAETNDLGENSYYVSYMDGIMLDEGNGNTKSNIDPDLYLKTVLEDVFTGVKPGDEFYILSLRSDIIDGFMNHGQAVEVTNRGETKQRTLIEGGFKEGDVFDKSMLVLLKCTYESSKGSNYTDINLIYKEKYDISNGEFPTDYISPVGGHSKLVE